MSLDKNLDKIQIIDFGSQFTQLIARRIRELGAYSEIISHEKSITIKDFSKIKGIILSGGPMSVYGKSKLEYNKNIFNLKIPILGICFGHQIMSKKLGGRVKQSKFREYGLATVKKKNKSTLIEGFFNKNNISDVWMSHSDEVIKIPKDFKVLGSSINSKNCIIENQEKKFYGIQFHPEVTHTKNGKLLLKNFIYKICKIKKNWLSKDQKKKLLNEIKNQVGESRVICALSGGVDSSVVALLISKAIKRNLLCIMVDTGLMRKNEFNYIYNVLKKKYVI